MNRATAPTQIDYLTKSAKASHHLFAVINDILDISKIEAERLKLEKQSFSLALTINDTLRIHDEEARIKG